jgi:trehalose utilization protein
LEDESSKRRTVLLWWGHMAHGEVSCEIVESVRRRVLEGMGLIVLHSGH